MDVVKLKGGSQMNLRQKVKKAKKELIISNDNYNGSTPWDIYKNFEITSRLQEIIDYKRKPSRNYNWNEEYKIDWGKLTYIKLQANSSELLILKSPNGKPLTRKQIVYFFNQCRAKMYQHGVKVHLKDSTDELYTEYVLYLSDDRKKQKRFHVEKAYRQYHGDDKLHTYNDILKINIEKENDDI